MKNVLIGELFLWAIIAALAAMIALLYTITVSGGLACFIVVMALMPPFIAIAHTNWQMGKDLQNKLLWLSLLILYAWIPGILNGISFAMGDAFGGIGRYLYEYRFLALIFCPVVIFYLSISSEMLSDAREKVLKLFPKIQKMHAA